MSQSDPHGGAQERSRGGDPAQQSESSSGSKRRRLSVDQSLDSSEYYEQVQLLGPDDSFSEEEKEEEEEEEEEETEKGKDEEEDDGDGNDDDGEDSVDGPGRHREEFKSFKHFVQELEDNVLPNDAIRRYSLYIESQKKTYFEAHKTEEWLRKKYHPSNLMAIVRRKKQRARASATQFFRKLENLPPVVGSTLESMNLLLVTLEDESGAESSLKTRRLILDIAQTQALALKLDTEKGIDNNILWPKNSDIHPAVKRLNRHELLRNLLEYLWCVHGVSYYGMRESEEDVDFTGVPEDVHHCEEDGWEETLRLFWQLRLKGEDPLERRAATKDIEEAVDKAINSSAVKVEDESMGLIYGCGLTACSRPFYSVESVREHYRASHPITVSSLETQMNGQFYYENYMRDPAAPVGPRNDEEVQPLLERNDRREVQTEGVEVNTAATSGNLNQHIQEVRGTTAASVDANQYVQEIRSGDNICSYRCNLEGCTQVVDARLPIQGHIQQDHRELTPPQFKLNLDPQENSNNAVAPAEDDSSNHSAS